MPHLNQQPLAQEILHAFAKALCSQTLSLPLDKLVVFRHYNERTEQIITVLGELRKMEGKK